MTNKDWEKRLKADGYTSVSTHQDRPDFEYPDHSHPVDTAYVVLTGEMTVQMEGKTYPLSPGERIDISKQVLHQAHIGKAGCLFLVGVKL